MTDTNAADDAQSPAKEDRALNAFALALQSSQLNPFLNVLGEAALACAAIEFILTYSSHLWWLAKSAMCVSLY
jgi:hypothetical protein